MTPHPTPQELDAALAAGPVEAAGGAYALGPDHLWRRRDGALVAGAASTWITGKDGARRVSIDTAELHAEAILGVDSVALITGVTRETWRTYVSRGAAPRPEGHVGGSPWWTRHTIERWVDSRADH